MSDENEPDKSAKKKIVDVEKPEKAAPPSTSKPVIISNRPVLKDPMVVEDDKTDDKPGDEKPAESDKKDSPELKHTGGQTTIQPLNPSPAEKHETAPQPDAQPEAQAEAEPEAGPEKAEEPAPAEAPKPPTPNAPSGAPGNAPGNIPGSAPGNVPDGALANAPGKDTQTKPTTDAEKKLAAEAAKKAEHEAEIQKLIDGGQYVLPINTVEKRQAKHFIVLGAVAAAILVLVWIDIALDASLIHIGGLHPLTHFFSN